MRDRDRDRERNRDRERDREIVTERQSKGDLNCVSKTRQGVLGTVYDEVK